jgi:hypothetical protein
MGDLRLLARPALGRVISRGAAATLKLFGMRAAYDEIVATAVKRQLEPQRVVGDMLTAELSEKQPRSIKYQITIAKLPLAKEIEDFAYPETPVNEALVRDLAGGGFLLREEVAFRSRRGRLSAAQGTNSLEEAP